MADMTTREPDALRRARIRRAQHPTKPSLTPARPRPAARRPSNHTQYEETPTPPTHSVTPPPPTPAQQPQPHDHLLRTPPFRTRKKRAQSEHGAQIHMEDLPVCGTVTPQSALGSTASTSSAPTARSDRAAPLVDKSWMGAVVNWFKTLSGPSTPIESPASIAPAVSPATAPPAAAPPAAAPLAAKLSSVKEQVRSLDAILLARARAASCSRHASATIRKAPAELSATCVPDEPLPLLDDTEPLGAEPPSAATQDDCAEALKPPRPAPPPPDEAPERPRVSRRRSKSDVAPSRFSRNADAAEPLNMHGLIACAHFALDLTADRFGICKCGKPRSEHSADALRACRPKKSVLMSERANTLQNLLGGVAPIGATMVGLNGQRSESEEVGEGVAQDEAMAPSAAAALLAHVACAAAGELDHSSVLSRPTRPARSRTRR